MMTVLIPNYKEKTFPESFVPSILASLDFSQVDYEFTANKIFQQAVADYHQFDDIDHPIANPYDTQSLQHLLYLKCWIDTVQWHMEDAVRNPNIDPQEGLNWKRRIDAQNQVRTDTVEYIDSYYLQKFAHVNPLSDAKINTESPAWAIDRLSI